jgi:hypothetical protein
MAMDESTQRSFIRFLAKEVRLYYRELLVHQFAVHILKQSGVEGIDALLETARSSEAVQKKLDQQFQGFDELLPPGEKEILDQQLLALLERWKPAGEPN